MISPNQEYLRRGNMIRGFVIHKTEGSFESAVNWCINTKSQVSYHFIIKEDGEDICLVMPENTAWHAGLVRDPQTELTKAGPNPNLYTIGIALSGYASEPPTASQIVKCAKLINTLAIYYNIKLDKKTVVTHNSIRADKICPGPYVSIDSILYLANLPQS
jgi:N-acetyl-anhydromuramyl-L-alanine amidase AmpD